ncbi:hypothetical protein DL770_001861 [Monosporascus sp. CRB-9-2]|nr:hypothetical protein DL770_001861 [Monosporascus sp. CRB-9-2]
MDPATIVQIVGTVVSIGDVVIRCINRLSSIKTKYHDAPMLLSTLIGQLFIVKAALDQLSYWKSRDLSTDPRYHQLALQIDNSLDCFVPLMMTLQLQLDRFDTNGPRKMTPNAKISFLWNEREMTDYLNLLDRQVNALNLLLQAIQWYVRVHSIEACLTWNSNTFTQQQYIISKKENQSILKLAKDCSSSIIGLGDTTSLVSEDTAAISHMFDFDAVILGSRVYQAAERSHLRQAVRAWQNQRGGGISALLPPSPEIDPGPMPTDNAAASVPERHDVESFGLINYALNDGSTVRPEQRNTIEDSLSSETQGRTAGAYFLLSEEYIAQANASESDEKSKLIKESSMKLESLPPKASRNSRFSLRPRAYSLSSWWKGQQSRKSAHPDRVSYEPEDIRTNNVVILGISESGKTTLIKALKLVAQGGYSNEERKSYSLGIWHDNTVQPILDALKETGSIAYEKEENLHHERIVKSYDKDPSCALGVSSAITSLWADSGFRAAYRECRPTGDLGYFVKHIERIDTTDYVPTAEDILRSYTRTSSVDQYPLKYRDVDYTFFDVGGTRAMRKKWIHAYEDASTLIFTADATAYARSLYEDLNSNGMVEQLMIFEGVVNSHWFAKAKTILVFTKVDLLYSCLCQYPVADHFIDFPDLPAGHDYDVDYYMDHVEKRFLDLVRQPDTRKRISIVYANLLEVKPSNPAAEIFRILENSVTVQGQPLPDPPRANEASGYRRDSKGSVESEGSKSLQNASISGPLAVKHSLGWDATI